jgi:hypothetical protein
VVLPEELAIKGSVLVHQLKSLDFGERNAEFIEKTPQQIIEQVATLAKLIVQ